jgi:hypothetical protein
LTVNGVSARDGAVKLQKSAVAKAIDRLGSMLKFTQRWAGLDK